MFGRDSLKQFRAAPWETQEELQAFVDELGAVNPHEVERLLAVLVDRRAAAEGTRHRNRCAAFKAIAENSLDPALFAPFVKALVEGDAVVRRILAGVLPRVNDVEAHEPVCKMLGSDSPELRHIAADLLRQVGGPTALAHLTKLVAQPRFSGRTEAMDVMVAKAKHRAIPLLAAVARSGVARERALALRSLGDPNVGGRAVEEAIAAVRVALSDEDRRVASEAFKAFGQLVSESAFFDELEPRIWADEVDPALIESLGSYTSKRALDVLHHKIRVGPNAVRLAAIRALVAMRHAQAGIPLTDALAVDDPNVRKDATQALVDLCRERVVDLAKIVIVMLRSHVPEVRRIAAHVSREVGDPTGELTPRLLGHLRDEDWWVRERVMDALVELIGPRLTEHVVGFLGDENPLIRRFAIGGLIRLRDPGSLGAVLRAAVEDDDWWVREQAVQACAALADARAIPYLEKMALERPDLRIVALESLRALGAHDALLSLAELAADENPDVRHTMLQILGDVPNGAQAAFYVQACLGDSDARVARAARELLARWEIHVEREAAAASLGLLDRLLVAAVRSEADDLVLLAGRTPYVKRLGAIQPLSRGVVSNDELASMLTSAMSGTQATDLAAGRDVDLSYAVKAYALRFRASIFRQATGLGAVFRHVRQTIPDIAALGLPAIIETFGDYPQGLVLVGGPTGSGKSTTLAALIDSINRRHNWHIVTIEDPVEVVHAQRESLVNQREVGTHARSFGTALRSTLRQDPDVILVGELRDLETIEFAVNAAETGHLVFGTVHTVSADSSIERLIHAFPGRQQYLIRSMLAESLKAVVCQQLLRRVDRPEARVVAAEVMINGDAIANLIRKEKTFQIASVIATHREEGMILMDQELERLVKQGVIDPDEALMKAVDKNAFATMLVSGGFIEDIEGRASLPPEARASIAPPAVRSSMPPAPAPAPAPGAGRTGGPPSGRPMSIPAGGGTSGTER